MSFSRSLRAHIPVLYMHADASLTLINASFRVEIGLCLLALVDDFLWLITPINRPEDL